jgi:ATP-binding cassette subfamily F protein 3
MVPQIRNILGGFLFSGDDVYKKVGVLSGGERTRLAVARMLLRPANTLLLDEPTNHLDLDSKDVLLDALEDFGGTLILVSHDRYFVDRLATKIIDVGGGDALLYPGGYEEYRWSQAQREKAARGPQLARAPVRTAAVAGRPPANGGRPQQQETRRVPGSKGTPVRTAALQPSREDRKRAEADARRQKRALEALQARIAELEARISERERTVRELELAMAAPGFYEDVDGSRGVIDRHQALMWEVGDLMHQWEELQKDAERRRA